MSKFKIFLGIAIVAVWYLFLKGSKKQNVWQLHEAVGEEFNEFDLG